MAATRELTHLFWGCDDDTSIEGSLPPSKAGSIGVYKKNMVSSTVVQPGANTRMERRTLNGRVALIYGGLSPQAAAHWLRTLRQGGLPTDPRTPRPRPNEQQKRILERVIERCLQECVDEANDVDFRSEPLRFLLHGVPGAGKSEVLYWLRDFFENVCLWTHRQ